MDFHNSMFSRESAPKYNKEGSQHVNAPVTCNPSVSLLPKVDHSRPYNLFTHACNCTKSCHCCCLGNFLALPVHLMRIRTTRSYRKSPHLSSITNLNGCHTQQNEEKSPQYEHSNKNSFFSRVWYIFSAGTQLLKPDRISQHDVQVFSDITLKT